MSNQNRRAAMRRTRRDLRQLLARTGGDSAAPAPDPNTPEATPPRDAQIDGAQALLDQFGERQEQALERVLGQFTAALGDAAAVPADPSDPVQRALRAQDTPDGQPATPAVAPDPIRHAPQGHSRGATEYGQALRAIPGWEGQYRSLPAWQREFRSPEGDFECQRFVRAVIQNDLAVIREYQAQARQASAAVRAAMAVGDFPAGGGVADGTAGAVIPLPMANIINSIRYKMARMRRIAMTFTSEAETIRVPIQGSEPGTQKTAELTAIAEGSPAVDEFRQLRKTKQTNRSIMSNELIESSPIDLGNWLANQVGPKMAQEEDVEYLNSTGATASVDVSLGLEKQDPDVATGPPAAYVPLIDGVGFLIQYADVVGLYFSLPESERANAVFSGNDRVALALSLVRDGDGRPIFNMQPEAGRIVGDQDVGTVATATLLGKPFVILPGAESATGATNPNTNRLYFSNMMQTYAILEGTTIQVAVSQEAGTAFETDSTWFRFIRRYDGIVIDPNSRHYRFTDNIVGAAAPGT